MNYVKGREGERNEWVARFRFADLTPGETYTATAFGPDGAAPITICTVTADRTGSGGCTMQFPDVPFLGGARVTDSAGNVALLALRPRGDITSVGGCREPEAAGAICDARGRN